MMHLDPGNKLQFLDKEPQGSFFLHSNTRVITKVLLCNPLHFCVNYKINPWMKPGSVNQKLALSQWGELFETLQKLGIEVETINQVEGLPDMVFAADQGIIKGKKVILSNFRFKERQKESKIYRDWFLKKGFEVLTLPNKLKFEGGGESLWAGDTLLIGTGFRSSKECVHYISNLLQTQVIAIELINPKYYHLDTCLFPLNKEILFYVENTVSKKSLTLLREIFPIMIPFNSKEGKNFVANNIISGKTIVTQKGNNLFKRAMQILSFNIIELDFSEFIKAGGGPHCLVSTLEEKNDY